MRGGPFSQTARDTPVPNRVREFPRCSSFYYTLSSSDNIGVAKGVRSPDTNVSLSMPGHFSRLSPSPTLVCEVVRLALKWLRFRLGEGFEWPMGNAFLCWKLSLAGRLVVAPTVPFQVEWRFDNGHPTLIRSSCRLDSS